MDDEQIKADRVEAVLIGEAPLCTEKYETRIRVRGAGERYEDVKLEYRTKGLLFWSCWESRALCLYGKHVPPIEAAVQERKLLAKELWNNASSWYELDPRSTPREA